VIHTANWDEIARLIARERGDNSKVILPVIIKDGKVHVETEGKQ